MLPFGVTIPDPVPQKAEIPEGLMNYPVQVVYHSAVVGTDMVSDVTYCKKHG
jgi:hypothetical protein